MDKISLQRINQLHPSLRALALKTWEQADAALTGRAMPRVTYGLRTFKEQQDLFNLGRTVKNPDGLKASKPMGNIVTNARAGQSIHNYGLALDFALIIDGKEASWNTIKDFDGDGIADWMEVVNVFKANGWEWGGDWKSFKDGPHFQFDFGYSWQQLQAKYNSGQIKDGYVILEHAPLSSNVFRTTTALNLRTGAGTGYPVITVLLKGETVMELERNGAWSLVAYNGKRGYVSNKYLTK